MMDSFIKGSKAFSYIEAKLPPGMAVVAESGAMASMDTDIDMKSHLNGGILNAILLKFFGKESLFVNRFINTSQEEKKVVLSQSAPGQICMVQLQDETLYIQAGAFIAATEGVQFKLRWAGFTSWIGGEGLFRIHISGTGCVWYGAYGAIIEKEVDGEYLVDTGHLLSYPEGMDLKLQMAGGLFSSFFGGEGFLLKLRGKGRIKLQTRSISGLAGWLNPRFKG